MQLFCFVIDPVYKIDIQTEVLSTKNEIYPLRESFSFDSGKKVILHIRIMHINTQKNAKKVPKFVQTWQQANRQDFFFMHH